MAPSAEAVQVRKVYRGIANYDLSEPFQTVPIGGVVDPAQTIVLVSNIQSSDTAYDRSGFFIAQLAGDNAISIERGGADGTATAANTTSVAWQVIEFADGVRVQSGISGMDKGELSKTITLPALSPALDIAKSIPIVTFKAAQGVNNTVRYARTHEFFTEPTLAGGATTTLTLTRLEANSTSGDKPIAIVWQVIEFQTDSKVYTGTVCLPVPGVAGGTQSGTNNGLDPDGATANCSTNSGAFSPALSNSGGNALLFFYPKYGAGLAGEDIRVFVRGNITNSTTVTFTRGYAATTAASHVIIRYYVVDFTDGSGATGQFGIGTKGSLASSGDNTRATVSASTDAVDPSTIRITTSAAHGFAVGNLVLVSGHDNNTAANGTWSVSAVPTSTTFDITDLTGGIVEGSGAGAGGGTGFVVKLRNAADLTTAFTTVDSTRIVSLISSASVSSNSTTNTFADDLRYLGHVYQGGATWYLQAARAPNGLGVAADYEYIAYEFPAVTLKSPNGNEILTVDSTVNVTWANATSGDGHNWKLQMSTNGGGSYSDLSTGCIKPSDQSVVACTGTATGTTLSAGGIQWKVPDNIDIDIRLRLWNETDTTSDASCKRRCDSSNADFEIRSSISNVVTKDGGTASSILYVDDNDTTVTWDQKGTISSVKILIDRNQDGSFTAADDPPLATGVTTSWPPDAKSWAWAPRVSNIVGENMKIRVQSENNSLVFSDTGIIKIRPNLTMFDPTAATVALRGKTQRLKFCTTGTVGNIKVYLSTNTGVAYSPIDVNGVINGGGGYVITPTYAGAPTASCPGTAGVADEGYWDWPVPATAPIGTTNKIKIEKSDNANVVDEAPDPASAVFEIKASLTLTGPPLTEGLRTEQDKNITWTVAGGAGITTVAFKYTTSWSTCQNNSGTHACWVTSTTPDGSSIPAGSSPFIWNVPNIIGTDVGIRLHDTANVDLIFEKRGPFTVKGRIATVSAPAAKDVLRVGTNKSIIWDAKGSIGAVDVCLLKEGSTNCDYTIASGITLPTETAAWNNIAATEMCSTCEVKVFLPGDPGAENADGTGGVSKKSGIFSVKGNITNAARDTATYNVGNPAMITWTATPTTLADSVRVRYDSNNGLGADGLSNTADDYPTILATVPASDQSYQWNIPAGQGLTSGTSKVRIEYVNYGLAEELAGTINSGQGIMSDTPTFSIKGTLTLTGDAKNGGVTWKVGEQKTITWLRNGSSMGDANILYSVDGGATYNLIKTLPSGNETYTWCIGYNDGCSGTGGEPGGADDAAHDPDLVIPTDRNTLVKIRIEAVSDTSGIFDCTGTGADKCDTTNTTRITMQKRYLNVAVPSPTLYVGDNDVALSNISWTTQGITPPPSSITVLLAYDINSGKGADDLAGTPDDFPNAINGGNPLTDSGGYVWDVPDAIGTKVRVRVKSSAFPSDVYGDTSDFTIKGKILPVFPTGASTLLVGNAVPGGIQYVKKGTIGNLKIEYDHSGNLTELTTPGTGTNEPSSFAWTVAALDSIGGSVIDNGQAGTKNSKFKFTSLGTLPVTAETAPFQVRGELYDLKPDSGTGFDGVVFTIGSPTVLIKWKARGQIGNVRIRLDKYSGNGVDGNPNTGDEFAQQMTGPDATYPNADSLPYNYDGDGAGTDCDANNPCWQWTVPDDPSTTYRIRLESINNPATLPNGMATFVGNGVNFRIRGTVTVTTPNGVQTPHWKSGETKNIDWNFTGNIGDVSITLLYELDTDPPGLPYEQSLSITSDNNGTKPFPWAIPNTLSTEHAIVRITAVGDGTVTDDSNSEFKIKPLLALTAPNNNTFQWVVGTQYSVTWDPPLGDASTLKINFSTNGGLGADGTAGTADDFPDTDCVANLAQCQSGKGGLIAASVAAAAGSKSWVIPDIMTNEGVVRISKVGDATAYDDSNSYFYIKGSISNVHVKNAVLDPDPSTPIDLPIATTKYITWSYAGSLGTVNIHYATDAQQPSPTWQPVTGCQGVSVGSGGTGSCSWTIPNAPSPNTKVRVANVSNPNWQDVQQISPNGATGAGTYNSIIGSIQDVLVVADGNPATTNMEITGNKTIQWQPNGNITTFKVEYRKDGQSWVEITPGGGCGSSCYSTAGGSGELRQWTWSNIPSPTAAFISNDVDFKVSDYNDAAKVNCTSYDPCTASPVAAYIIKGKLSVVSPISTDVWTLGATATPSIRWSKQGPIGDIRIEYSTSGTFNAGDYSSGYVFTIADNYASGSDGNNDFSWPAGIIGANRKISDTGRIQIKNLAAPAGTELVVLSAAPAFKIRPSITSMTKPDATTVWFAQKTDTVNQVITWACNTGTFGDGTSPNVILEYSVDGGGYGTIPGAASLACSNGTNNFTWSPMADEKSNNVKVKARYLAYPDQTPWSLESPSFAIRPEIVVSLVPDGANTKLKVGSSYTNLIQWTYSGSTTGRVVEIHYDKGDGNGYVDPGQKINPADVAASAGQYSWNNVPNINSSNVKIRVRDKNFTSAAGESVPFKVMGELTLTGPTGGVTKTAATDTDVNWNFTGTIANVNIYYDPDTTNGLQWTLVGTKNQGACSGSCSYLWTTANTPPFPSAVGNNYRIKITNAADELDVLSEGTDFKIGAQFDVTAPENGAPVYAEESADITWNTVKGSGISKVRIYYSNNSEDPTPAWILITPAAGVANTSPYQWNPVERNLAALQSTAHRIKITQYDPANETEVYNIGGGGTFPILGKLIVTTPSTGSESWNVNTTQTIKFKKQGDLQSAELYYSYDGALANYVKIKRADNSTLVDISDATGVPDGQGNYSFPWFLDPATTNLTSGFAGKIKAKAVSPAAQSAVESLPSNTIEVKGTVTLCAPGGSTCAAGNDPAPSPMVVNGLYNIKWEKFGAVNNVEVHYSTNGGILGGGSYPAGNLIFDGASLPANFNWDPIPDKIGTNLRIRVRHKENTSVWDESDVVFRIKGKLELQVPENPGLSYTVGTQQTIQWKSTGTFSPVDLYYDTDGNFGTTGDTYPVQPLTTVTNCTPPGTPPYECTQTASFDIEDHITTNAKVRVRGTGANSDVLWISTDPFTIKGALDVTAPDQAAPLIVWNSADTNRTITWDATGTVTNVNIGYKLSAGASCNYTNVVSNHGGHAAGANNYPWPSVADEKSETVYICMQDANNSSVINVAANPFAIRPKVTVNAFSAPARIAVASNNANLITFTVTGTKTPTVDILLDRNGGADGYPETIASAVNSSSGPAGINWNNVPGPQTNNAKIKIVDSDVAFPQVNGVYPGTFKIVGSVTLTAPPTSPPTPKVQVKKGGSYLIQWNRTGDFANVSLWYSTNGAGGPFNQQIVNSTPANNVSATAGQYNWTNIADTVGTNVVIRATDFNDSETVSYSAPISIQRVFNITAPDGGEVWAVGTGHDITFTTDGTSSSNVKLQYATNGGGDGGNWADIAGATNLAVCSPTPCTTTFSWSSIPNAVTNNAKVRVVDLGDPDNWDESGIKNNPAVGIFKIRADLRMVSPNGGESWKVGETKPVQWFLNGDLNPPSGPHTVKLEVNVNGAGWTTMENPGPVYATGIPGTGQVGCTPAPCWNWVIPGTTSSNVLVRVVNEADSTNYDPSNNPFTIRGGFSWNNPNTAGDVFEVGSTEVLGWNTLGTITNVDILHSTNGDPVWDGPGDTNYTFIKDSLGADADNIVNNGTFNWPIPNTISKDVYLVLVDSSISDANDESVKIKIAGVISVVAPAGSERWGVGTTQQIRWGLTGSIANLKLEYSVNGGGGYVVPAITDSVLGTGQAGCNPAPCYNWTIPNNVSPTVVVKISDVITDSGTTAKVSNGFKIVGSFNISSPTAASIWPVTSGEIANPTQNIVWSTQGNVPEVKLFYCPLGDCVDIGGGVTSWTQIDVNGAQPGNGTIVDGGNGGSFAWSVPDAIGTNVYVRVEDSADDRTYQLAGPFTIRGDLQLTAPNGSEKWRVNDSGNTIVQWLHSGTMGNVKMYYSKNGLAGPWIDIPDPGSGQNDHGNDGSLVWNIPTDAMTTTARLRIEANHLTSDERYVKVESANNFKIMAKFDVTNPDGAEVAIGGQNYTVTWNSWGTGATNVKIDMATNATPSQPCSASYTYDKILKSNTANDGTTANDVPPVIMDPNWVTPAACVRIYDVNDIDSANLSAFPFVIRATFAFTAPNTAGQNLEVGVPFHITWDKQGNIPNVAIHYSRTLLGGDLAGTISPIEPTADGIVPNSDSQNPGDPTKGRYIWTVPDVDDDKDTTIYLRIRDPNDPGAFTISQSFNIIPRFAMTFPNGNANPSLTDKLKVGHRVGDTDTPYTITWTSTSAPAKTPSVVLRYSLTGGASFPDAQIIGTANMSTACTGPVGGVYNCSYVWASANGGVPATGDGGVSTITTQAKLRVEDASDGVAKDLSDNDWKIISNFRLNAPNGGATYDVGNDFNLPNGIMWENLGLANNVELAYSTGGAAFTSPVIFEPSTTNDGAQPWVIPDAISSTVRVRVKSTTDEGNDISNADFRIRGKLAVTSPTTGDKIPIGQNWPVNWTANGNIPQVDIFYDTLDGTGGYPYQIANDAPGCTPSGTSPYACNGSFNWTNVPDTGTVNGRIKIVDARAGESDVIGISNRFSIVGNFTVLQPNGGEDWRVAELRDVNFNWGGTIPLVRFHYSQNTAADPNTIPASGWIFIAEQNFGPGDGSGGAVRTYQWTIPDDLSPNVRVRVSDANSDTDGGANTNQPGNPDPNYAPEVRDYSNNFFTIRGSFTGLTPNGNANPNLTERWVTFDTKQITWTSNGTMPSVILTYSNDNFVSDIQTINGNAPNCTPTPPAIQCNGSYNWPIPDRVLKTPGGQFTVATDLTGLYQGANMVKVRVADFGDPAVYTQSTNTFKLDYYKITWDVRDLLTNAPLSQLTVKASRDVDPNFVIWNQAGITTNPPAVKYFPFGTWVTAWSKTEYTDMSVTVTADGDKDYSQAPLGPLFMQTSTVHIWTFTTGVTYDPDLDKLSVQGYLMRDGSLVPGPVQAFFKVIDAGVITTTVGSPTAANPKDAKISPQWGQGVVPPYQAGVHEPASPDAAGYFLFTVNAPTGLVAGKPYIGQGEVLIGTGGVFKTPTPFDISTPATLEAVKDTVNTMLDKPLSQVETAIKTELQNLMGLQQGETVKQILDAQTGAINTALTNFTTSVQASLVSLENAADEAVDAAGVIEDAAEQALWKASVTPNPATKAGEDITFAVQGVPGTVPILDVVSQDGKQVVVAQEMKEDVVNPGNYTFTFKLDFKTLPVGKAFTFTVTETTTGTSDLKATGVGRVEPDTAGLMGIIPGISDDVKKVMKAVENFEKSILEKVDTSAIKSAVEDLQKTVDRLPAEIEKQFTSRQSPVGQMRETLNDLSAKIDKFGKDADFDFTKMFTKAIDQNSTVKDIRQKTDDVSLKARLIAKAVTEKKAFLEVGYTSGSVKLRVVAVNPSAEDSQEIPVKIYLPQEVNPKDILDRGDLELNYDSDKSLYFVYKDKIILKPKEIRVFEIEIDDIWMIPKDSLDSYRTQTQHIMQRLQNTEYLPQAEKVAKTIFKRLDEIGVSQADESVNKELHIGIHRSNVKILEQIKEDIARIEKLLVAVGAPPAPEMLAESKLNLKEPSRATTWFIIFAILIFIGVLGSVFFFTWQAQVRLSSNLSSKIEEQVFPELHSLKKQNPNPARTKDESGRAA